MTKLPFYGSLPTEVTALVTSLGEKPYRVKQIYQWVYEKQVHDPRQMTSLSQAFREKLVENIDFSLPEVVKENTSSDGSTKYLLQLVDGHKIEMVLMPEDQKLTLCVSSQVGCSRNCAFCATAKMGLIRNLTEGEVVAQVILANRLASERRVTNLVFMGMGEPLDNYDSVLRALQILQSDPGLKFSPRHTTISTCGVVPRIRNLGASGVKVKLAVSLNSTLDEVRNQLMPVNRIYGLQDLKKCLLDFRKKTPFRITYEYIMIPDVNMDEKDIKGLRKFLGDQSCKLNLIPYNPVKGLKYRAPLPIEIEDFMAALSDLPIAVMLRKSKGKDIAGACGQLAWFAAEPVPELEVPVRSVKKSVKPSTKPTKR